MNDRCKDCVHLYYEDPEFWDDPVIWKCDCEGRCVKDMDYEERYDLYDLRMEE